MFGRSSPHPAGSAGCGVFWFLRGRNPGWQRVEMEAMAQHSDVFRGDGKLSAGTAGPPVRHACGRPSCGTPSRRAGWTRAVGLIVATAGGVAVGGVGAADAAPVPIGTIGDSLTDETTGLPFSYVRSWSQILEARDAIELGPTAAEAGLEGPAGWGGPRGAGFRNNWALAGARTSDALRDGQAHGLVRESRATGVTHAVVFLGVNDWSSWFQHEGFGWVYYDLYLGTLADDRLEAYIDARIGAYRVILDTLTAGRINPLVCTVPDFSVCPHTQTVFTEVQGLTRVRAAVTRYNARLRLLAAEYDAGVLDMAGLFDRIFGTPESPRTTMTLAGHTVRLRDRDTPTGEDALAAWSHDGLHPGTLVQGVMASAVATGLRGAYGVNVPAPSDAEIAGLVGLPALVGPTLREQLGAMEDLVSAPRWAQCPAEFDWRRGVSTGDLFVYLGTWYSGDLRADVDASGTLGVTDIITYLAIWFAGCP